MLAVVLVPLVAAGLAVLVLALGVALRRPSVTTVGGCRHPEGEPCPHPRRPALDRPGVVTIQHPEGAQR